jgi:predicted nucleic acid-binding protein
MVFKVFADANLLLDFLLKRNNYDTAHAIIKKGVEGKIQLFTTPAVMHITAYWTTKAYGNSRAKELLLALLIDVQIIDCDHVTSLVALNSEIDDIEDALQYYTALKHQTEYFISADKKLKKSAIPQLPVYSADEFLTEISD